jgi:succinyl-diaminopimelate desuccinylase
MSPTLSFAIELLSRPSITPQDLGCQELIAEKLRTLGFTIEPMKFGAVDNLWARLGNDGPVLCFAGHTDVVPPGPLEAWRFAPFSPTVAEGRLHARGAADMKGGIAAMITAIEAFCAQSKQRRGSLAVLLTSDEEGPAVDGTRRVIDTLQARGERIDWCVVGEPSSHRQVGDTLRVGRRGSLSGQLTVHGKQGHTAYPQLADNPIHTFAPALLELTQRGWDQGNEHFPATHLQFVNVNAGAGAPNVIPGELKTQFNFRYSPLQTMESLESAVLAILQKHQIQHTLTWRDGGRPFYSVPRELATAAREAVQTVCGLTAEYSTGGGTSDGRFIAPTGCQVVELGPINATIHQVNECINIEDLEKLQQIYLHIMQKLLT